MSVLDDLNPLAEAVIPRLEGMLNRAPSYEELIGARERFSLLAQSIAEISASFAETPEERMANIVDTTDTILGAKVVELSPDASELHRQKTEAHNAPSNVVPINKYSPDTQPLQTVESSLLPEQQSMRAEALALIDAARANHDNVVPIYLQNPDGLLYSRDGVEEKNVA